MVIFLIRIGRLGGGDVKGSVIGSTDVDNFSSLRCGRSIQMQSSSRAASELVSTLFWLSVDAK